MTSHRWYFRPIPAAFDVRTLTPMIASTLRSLWNEPAVADPPRRVWRDWALIAVLAPAAVLEGLLRTDLSWPVVEVIVCLALMPTLLWRRVRPLACFGLIFAVVVTFNVVSAAASATPPGLGSTAYLLIVIYALYRWGSGRDGTLGMGMVFGLWAISQITAYTDLAEFIGGFIIIWIPVLLGATIRYRAANQGRDIEQAKMVEREQLARELHDSVAHHVSAIAVQAQAGRHLATTRPQAALECLEIIEEAASRTLIEMRTIVSALRSGDADMAPQPGIDELIALAHSASTTVPISVRTSGDVHLVGVNTQAALFRIAQESITNAVRHGRNATKIEVVVNATPTHVELTVSDDGEPHVFDADLGGGFGLIGMAERAKLLSGTFHAGRSPGRGWATTTTLPRPGTGS
jgi:signal transduction histidine kinase